MDTPEQVLQDAGLGEEYAVSPKLEMVNGFVCDICCDDGGETYALKCGHRFCADCWRAYLEGRIRDEGDAGMQCMADGCARVVDSKTAKLLVPASVYKRYVFLAWGARAEADGGQIRGSVEPLVCGR